MRQFLQAGVVLLILLLTFALEVALRGALLALVWYWLIVGGIVVGHPVTLPGAVALGAASWVVNMFILPAKQNKQE